MTADGDRPHRADIDTLRTARPETPMTAHPPAWPLAVLLLLVAPGYRYSRTHGAGAFNGGFVARALTVHRFAGSMQPA